MTRRIGLFVDLDGTLADSLAVMRHVYHRFLRERGRFSEDAEFDRLNGPPLADVVASLAKAHDLTAPLPDLLAAYWRLIGEAYEDVRPLPGAAALLAVARRHELPVALVTSNDRLLAARWLARVGLSVDVIVGGDDVARGKPHPDPYQLALARTGCSAAESFAVEDSASGAASAQAAGVMVYRLGDADWPDLSHVAADLARRVAS